MPLTGKPTHKLVMTEIAEFVDFCRSQLKPILGKSGNLLYSAASTLKPGEIYLIGLNPGGSPNDISQTVQDSLNSLGAKTSNSFLDESWRIRGRDLHEGQAPLQKRVNWLLTSLGAKTRDVCASNLIFERTSNSRNIDYPAMADICWPVHQEILRIVRPKLIVCFGNSAVSPYQYLKMRLEAASEFKFPSGHGSWTCRSFRSALGLKVVGLPHLSRYAVNQHPSVLQNIRA